MPARTRLTVRADDQAAMPPLTEYWRHDVLPPPPELLERSVRDDLGAARIGKDCFLSRDHHRLEVERMWKRVWQMACRERDVARPGDHATYEIADQSIVIVRGADGTLRAFHNVCLHRGTRLVEGRGSVGEQGVLRCTFHAWSWDTDGTLAHVPCRWDFPEVRDDEYRLRAVQVDTWDGWVFVNLDRHAPSLRDYLGETVVRHFERWPRGERFVAAHVGKVLPANWKVATAAFIETYHVMGTHPESVPYAYDAGAQYDQFGPHVARMLQLIGVPSPHLPDGTYDEQDMVDTLIGGQLAALNDADVVVPRVPPGGRARAVLADFNRAQLAAMFGVDVRDVSDAEILDVIEYYVFPNLVPWGGYSFPIVYRFRPNGDDHESCFAEVMLMAPCAGEPPPDAPLHVLPTGASWTEASELGGLGPILDQDDRNIRKIQLGMRSDAFEGPSLSSYQESNVRLLHRTLEDYLERP